MDNGENNRRRFTLWLKRLGIAGFLFFLGKGLLWLALPSLAIWMAAAQ